VAPGAHSVRAIVDPEDEISEGDETNNEVNGVALVAETQTFLPLIARDR
jgi:subtilase family serine protease